METSNPISTLGFIMSIFVSTLSILLVAVYQLITIRIDPFGARHIITTTRCYGACIATWIVSFGPTAFVVFFQNNESGAVIISVLIALVVIITGCCYFLIYRSIARSLPGHAGGDNQTNRTRENQKVLGTFGLVYGTTFIAWALVAICRTTREIVDVSECLKLALFELEWMTFILNWIADTIIYWWRLKEFRSVVLSFTKFSGTRHFDSNS